MKDWSLEIIFVERKIGIILPKKRKWVIGMREV